MKSCVVVGPHDVKLLQAAVGVICTNTAQQDSADQEPRFSQRVLDQIKKDDLDAQAKLL